MSKAKYPTSTKYPITTPALISMCVLCVNVVRWYNYVSSDEVQSRIGLSTASSIVRKWRLGLFDHVARLPDGVSAIQILQRCCEVVSCHHPTGSVLDLLI